jgi:hypothetical protein
MRNPWLTSAVAAAGMLLTAVSPAATDSCDRTCLNGLADQLIASMVAHDTTRLPLARVYAATENSVPSALNMMVAWRTVTSVKGSYYVIDSQSGQVFLIATLSEGPNDSLLFGRIRVEQRLLAEIELYVNRSRGQSGFQFSPYALANFPKAWTDSVAPARRSSRSELLKAGRSIFDTRVSAPDISPGCLLMENGKMVAENPDGTVPIPCGSPPNRPTDSQARTDIVDEEQGVVVSIAIVHGVAQPYLVTNPTESAFVPDAMLAPYTDMLKQQQSSGKYQAASLRPMPATQVVAELHRLYDGKLQGMMMLQTLGAPGSHSPWVIN